MNQSYTPFETLVLRTPSYSLNKFQSLVSNEISLIEYCKCKAFQEALYIASPVLFYEMKKWLEGSFKEGKELEKLKLSLYKYAARMSTRSTPFGLFAGLGVGKLIDFNRYEVKSTGKYRVTRPDMNFACALGQKIAQEETIKKQIKFFPNNSIYNTDDKLRYVEYLYNKFSKRIHQVTAVDNNPYINTILKSAENGAKINDLANSIVEDDISQEEAQYFVNELINAQLLVSEFEPQITNADYWGFLISKLNNLIGCDEIIEDLENIREILNELDSKPSGVEIDAYYEKIKNILSKYEVKFEEKYLFQTDMLIRGEFRGLDEELSQDVLAGLQIMNKFTYKPHETLISQFANEFHKRYEDAEMPLLKVLDPEIGLGYPANRAGEADLSPLLEGLVLPSVISTDRQFKWNAIQSFLLRKYQESVKNNSYNVELKDDELTDFKSSFEDLPNTMSAMVQLLPPQNESQKNSILLNSIGGNSALCLIGRFCHASNEMYKHAKEIAEKEIELEKQAIIAEIVHLPEARTGNILMHPKFYKYEIPYLAQAAVNDNHTVLLSDIMISIRQNKVMLRSKKHNKYVIPRLSNAHNFSYNGLPVYRFLCDMQQQGKRSGVSFSWGSLSSEYTFLPRVTYKNLILSLATWQIKIKDIDYILKENNDDGLLIKLNEFREKYKIPQWATLADGDNELVIDFKNLLSVKAFVKLVEKRTQFSMHEYLHNPQHTPLKNENGEAFANQVILSFYKNVN